MSDGRGSTAVSWRMREAFAIFLSTVAAAAAPAAIFALYVLSLPPDRPGTAFVAFCMSFMLALGHAMVLGLPAALALVHKRAFRAGPMLIAGGVVGLLPAGLVFFPYAAPRDWTGYLTLAGTAAGLGASGGIAFHLAHRIISPGSSSRPEPPRRQARPRAPGRHGPPDTR